MFRQTLAKFLGGLLLFMLLSSLGNFNNLSAQTFDFLPTSTTGQMVKHTYYALSYSEKHEQAEWVAYELKGDMLKGPNKRKDNFRSDPLVKTGSATLADYKGFGYDRGHLAPAADMTFDAKAMSESFFLSNMSPQAGSFNRGIWKQLEGKVRSWAESRGQIYVVTGPILNSQLALSIGPNKLTVPKYYYKVILEYNKSHVGVIALILPNEKGTHVLSHYVSTVDSLEGLTGIDFFPGLSDSQEHILESRKDMSWFESSVEHKPVESAPIKPSVSTSARCKGFTQAGSQCKRNTDDSSGECWQHNK